MFDKFSQTKKAVLSKQDKSSKGNWDEKISKLCEKINKKENCFTTSSCSGRIVLMIDQEKKEEGLFKFVSHDLISFGELKNEVEKILHSQARGLSGSEQTSSSPSLREKNFNEKNSKDNKLILARDNINNQEISEIKNYQKSNLLNIKFKQEPCILHVACKDLEGAKNILKQGQSAGWKRSGIISLDKNIFVELNGTDKLEFPIIHDGELIINDKFLKIIAEKANDNLKKSWKKIKNLEKNIN